MGHLSNVSIMDITTLYTTNVTSYGEHFAFSGRPEYAVIVPTVWIVLIIIGAIGNGLVIYTLSKNGEITATNCYIVNLAIADLTFLLIVVPFTAASYAIPNWIFGDFMCKTATYMVYVTLHATSFTLTAMTIDRYHAIVHPLSSMNWRNRRISTITCILVWAVALVISVPFALYHETAVDAENRLIYCQEAWPDETLGKVILVTVTGTNYVLPLTIILICYYQILRTMWEGYRRKKGRSVGTAMSSESQTRRKKRMTRMVAVIILLFATFWFPAHVLNIYTKLYPDFPKTEPMFIIKFLAHTLSYANSCVNPFIYAFLNDRFKKSFVKTFPIMSYWFPCMRNIIEELDQTRVTNMVDQAIQAGADDNDNDHVEENYNHIQMQKLQESSLL